MKLQFRYKLCVGVLEPQMHTDKHRYFLYLEPLAKPRHSGMFLAGLKRLRFERLQGGPKGERSE